MGQFPRRHRLGSTDDSHSILLLVASGKNARRLMASTATEHPATESKTEAASARASDAHVIAALWTLPVLQHEHVDAHCRCETRRTMVLVIAV